MAIHEPVRIQIDGPKGGDVCYAQTTINLISDTPTPRQTLNHPFCISWPERASCCNLFQPLFLFWQLSTPPHPFRFYIGLYQLPAQTNTS